MPKISYPCRRATTAADHAASSSKPQFVLILDDVAVARVPAADMLDACGEILWELIRRQQSGTAIPALTARQIDAETAMSLPAFSSAADFVDSWSATAGPVQQRGA